CNRRVEEMSKGMQQRLGIAQALVGRPRLLLLDEPTSALDPVGRRTVRQLLEELRSQGVSVLPNSHLLSEVELVCDRVVILLDGRVAAAGTTAELARPRGVEIETDEGVRLFERAGRADAPRLVEELVAAGRRVYGVRALSEAVRRKVFLVVLVLTAIFLTLYGIANYYIFRDVTTLRVPEDVHVDARTFAAAFTLGLAMFATLFLGVVLGVFLTIGVVSGDGERGLLQPLVARPVGRRSLLLGRFLAAGAVCASYVVVVYLATMVITGLIGEWWPHTRVWPGVLLAGSVLLMVALSLLGSVFLGSTANGIAVFMLFVSGLVGGLLGTIGHAIGSPT